jgi:beta-glucosidase
MKQFLAFITIIIFFLSCSTVEPYKDYSLPVETRVADLLARMTLQEKASMVSGVNTFYTQPIERLGIPSIAMTDGPIGINCCGPATSFPAGPAMASTWDTTLIYNTGVALAIEAIEREKNMILGPTLNIHRVAGGGRNFESFGEDPFLAARIGVAYVKGMQDMNVAACAKHYTTNNHEYNRLAYDVIADDGTMNEIYLPAFRAVVEEAGALAMMSSYNKVNGYFASANHKLLTETLKDTWGFEGIVLSDFGAVHGSADYINAGLDLEMPGGIWLVQDTILKLIDENLLTVERLDDAVSRILTVMFSIGLFDGAEPKVAVADRPVPADNSAEIAAKGTVLLKNNGVLPVNIDMIKSIAVLGPASDTARTGAGGSSHVRPVSALSPLQAIVNQVGDDVSVYHSIGTFGNIKGKIIESRFMSTTLNGKISQGLTAEYFDNMEFKGQPMVVQVDSVINFAWPQESHPDMQGINEEFSVRWKGQLTADQDGLYAMSISSDDGSRLYVNGELLIDNWGIQGVRTRNGFINLQKDVPVDIMIEYFENTGYAAIQFAWEYIGEDRLIAEAVEAAKKSDVAIIYAGLSIQDESEGWDYPYLRMPGNQDALISSVAEVNKNTIVVLYGGMALDMRAWIDDVAAVIHAWYPGQFGSEVLSDIIFGNINPSGKLPTSFIKKWTDSYAEPDYPEVDGKVVFKEGIFVGYRYYDKNNVEVQFPFGHGLSYTNFDYSNIQIKQQDQNHFTIQADITNTGQRQGDEIVQLYVEPLPARADRPVKELKGFSRIALDAGQSKSAVLYLDPSAFSVYDALLQDWKVVPGKYRIHLGASSADLLLYRDVEIME